MGLAIFPSCVIPKLRCGAILPPMEDHVLRARLAACKVGTHSSKPTPVHQASHAPCAHPSHGFCTAPMTCQCDSAQRNRFRWDAGKAG